MCSLLVQPIDLYFSKKHLAKRYIALDLQKLKLLLHPFTLCVFYASLTIDFVYAYNIVRIDLTVFM